VQRSGTLGYSLLLVHPLDADHHSRGHAIAHDEHAASLGLLDATLKVHLINPS
jgi:hypothetical protein